MFMQKSLIKPFKSLIAKQSIGPGERSFTEKTKVRLDLLGIPDASDLESVTMSLSWTIAHQHHDMLKPCIGITNARKGRVSYEINLYAGGIHTRKGSIDVNDMLSVYQNMDEAKRKDSILTRIALANVKLLVPYVRVDRVEPAEGLESEVLYRITL